MPVQGLSGQGPRPWSGSADPRRCRPRAAIPSALEARLGSHASFRRTLISCLAVLSVIQPSGLSADLLQLPRCRPLTDTPGAVVPLSLVLIRFCLPFEISWWA